MSRNLGASCKQCRREGTKLYLKGMRCHSEKCAVRSNFYPPGQISMRRKKETDYCRQLREKQKVKRIYGLLEKQFRMYYQEAERRKGVTGDNLVKLLESRLDNVIYRLNFACSRNQARQLISHGHVTVNGRKVAIASRLLRPGDTIEIKEKSKKIGLLATSVKGQKSPSAHWLEVDQDNFRGKVVSLPEVQDLDIPMNLQFIVELYSK